MEPFQHTPLDLGNKLIRLVEVLLEDTTTVQCRVEIYDHDTCPEYQAVSYVWGDAANTTTIVLNGQTFSVRDNLWHFLKVIACSKLGRPDGRYDSNVYQSPAKYLWIDQLCIDQKNSQERNHQVQRMAAIFTRAVSVIAWLGDADERSEKAMRIISNYDPAQDVLASGHEVSNKAYKKITSQQYHRGMAVSPLFQRPYWTRLWIAQEFILPHELVLACGTYVIPWAELRAFYKSMLAVSKSMDVFGEAEIFIIFRDGAHPSTDIPRTPRDFDRLDIALIWFSHLDCQDSRDKVYGLLGLVQAQDRIPIHYEKPANQIFWEVLAATKYGLSVCSTQFRLLGWSMGVTGTEPESTIAPAAVQFRRIFGDQKPIDVFSAEEQKVFEAQRRHPFRG